MNVDLVHALLKEKGITAFVRLMERKHGIVENTVWMWLHRKSIPQKYHKDVAAYLGVTVDSLL